MNREVFSLGVFPSLPRRGGRAIKKWSRSEKARTGWSLASHVSECVLKHLRVSDHPVCGASVASRLFSDAAATPPHEEGNAHRLNNSRIRSPGHRPPLQTICKFKRAYSPPCKEGWPRHQEYGPVPKRRGRGGRSQVTFRNAF